MADKEDWAGPRPLRVATIVSFALAHGIVSNQVVPATGLVPLAFSAGVGIALLRPRYGRTPHPAAIFAADVVLAAALIAVLVLTWITAPHSRDAGLSMLASYATVPLLASLYVETPRSYAFPASLTLYSRSLIHLFLAVRAVYVGLALDSLTQWLAWQVLPPDCPNCQHHLRPPFPSFPWLRRSDDEEQARLLVDDQDGRYRDDDSTHVPAPPVAEEVTRKDRKGKGTSPAAAGASDSTPWDT